MSEYLKLADKVKQMNWQRWRWCNKGWRNEDPMTGTPQYLKNELHIRSPITVKLFFIICRCSNSLICNFQRNGYYHNGWLSAKIENMVEQTCVFAGLGLNEILRIVGPRLEHTRRSYVIGHISWYPSVTCPSAMVILIELRNQDTVGFWWRMLATSYWLWSNLLMAFRKSLMENKNG